VVLSGRRLLLEEENRSDVRAWMALALASTVACRALMVSMSVLRSSPMVLVQEDAGGDGGAAAGCGGGVAAAGGE
jgi:hypothetical protein